MTPEQRAAAEATMTRWQQDRAAFGDDDPDFPRWPDDDAAPDTAGVAAELREVADHMAETADLDATKGTA